ncbi:hypothetical protein FSARC_13821 [Fusarium sarcochroum]|uniref:Uncharacterized protein n=1 Tax=Fusarium sarcochroum TaxID=1208366 RepID=A0A8H4WS07_9HYPO|nr:hypothetical protein FSARC_13821 [Fusarium sarcochroum]
MSSFVVKLWEDIFTPGPTPTILKAANASFAALQTVLFLLLLATYNIHCVILSILCAGLWWSVNWFAAELAIAQREQREKEQRDKQQQKEALGNDDDSETEVETSAPNKAPPVASVAATTSDVAAAAGLEPVETKGEVKQRAGAVAGTQSSVSTEDEWEKVSEAENEKDK